MDLLETIRTHATQPLTHQLLISMLKGYQKPNSKIQTLLRNGMLEPIKKGIYIAGPALSGRRKPEPFLLANHILGPSYVSLETALSYYDVIPERVHEIASVTTKASRHFKTAMGVFTYTRLSLPYYSFGIQQIKLSDDQYAMVASPEKALCDKVVTTSGLLFRSKKSATSYLIEGMRMDEDRLKDFDLKAMSSWLEGSTKKEESLQLMIAAIGDL